MICLWQQLDMLSLSAKLEVFETRHIAHDIERGHEGEPTRGTSTNMNLVLGASPLSVGDSLALFHGHLVKLSKVVCLLDARLTGLALVVKEGGVVLGDTLVVLHVSERVEDLLIGTLGVLELLRLEIVHVAVGAARARLVSLVFLGAHAHHISDTLLNH